MKYDIHNINTNALGARLIGSLPLKIDLRDCSILLKENIHNYLIAKNPDALIDCPREGLTNTAFLYIFKSSTGYLHITYRNIKGWSTFEDGSWSEIKLNEFLLTKTLFNDIWG